MPKGLTDVQLKALVADPPRARVELKDGVVEGLTVRVGPRGRPAWTFRFRVRGGGGASARGTALNGARYHRIAIGTYPAVTIKAARAKAGAYAEAIERGENPIDALENAAVDRSSTVDAFIDSYLAYAEQSMRSWRNARWILNRHMRPRWGERPPGAIREQDARSLVLAVQTGVQHKGSSASTLRNGAAAEVRKWGSMLFSWGRRHGIVKSNPFENVPAPKLAARQRFLTMDEARAVWRAASNLPYPWSPALKLLLLTGCRENEICGAKWAWYEAKGPSFLIPHNHYKSDRDFLVALPTAARALIETLPRFQGDFMLSTTGGLKPIAGVPRKILDRLHVEAEVALGRPIKRFTLHDLRRTVRTHLSRMGISDVVAELVLGHALKGLQARYNVYGYADEKRAALERWYDELFEAAKPIQEA